MHFCPEFSPLRHKSLVLDDHFANKLLFMLGKVEVGFGVCLLMGLEDTKTNVIIIISTAVVSCKILISSNALDQLKQCSPNERAAGFPKTDFLKNCRHFRGQKPS